MNESGPGKSDWFPIRSGAPSDNEPPSRKQVDQVIRELQKANDTLSKGHASAVGPGRGGAPGTQPPGAGTPNESGSSASNLKDKLEATLNKSVLSGALSLGQKQEQKGSSPPEPPPDLGQQVRDFHFRQIQQLHDQLIGLQYNVAFLRTPTGQKQAADQAHLRRQIDVANDEERYTRIRAEYGVGAELFTRAGDKTKKLRQVGGAIWTSAAAAVDKESPFAAAETAGKHMEEEGKRFGGQAGAAMMMLGRVMQYTLGLPEKIRHTVEVQHEANMKYAAFSPNMAKVYMEQQIRDIYYNRERGEVRSESSRKLAEAMSDFREARAPIEDDWNNMMNEMKTKLAKAGKWVVDLFTSDEQKKEAKEKKEKIDNQVTVADWMTDIATVEYAKVYGRPPWMKGEK